MKDITEISYSVNLEMQVSKVKFIEKKKNNNNNNNNLKE
jgi:hypothetical protein